MQLLGTLPSALWSTSPTDVGLIKDQDPIKVKLVKSDRPKLKQYPLTQETQEGIGPVIKDMLKAGILRKTDTPICKTPIFPVKKANGKWRMVQDLRAVNAIVEPEPVEVANPHTLLNSIGSRDKWFSVVDLSNALFSVPLDRESQDLFAFQYNGQMYTYTRLPQGFTNSPTLYSQALRASMTRCSPLINGQYLLYVDDILITGHTKQDCERNTLTVLQHLYAEGHKVSKTRIQLCQPEVVYLGHILSQNGHFEYSST
uniref:ribonuclease H n=1 Tax=Amphiprion ocellaris TaxID=80972 RepID=A0AAQ5YK32_AMPOC